MKMISSIISRLVILICGTLYPAYASYKAVRTKNVKEYVKWMMYWIVFALFTCAETFTDVFLSWFPFYYEIKIILVIWLLSPATKGSSILYRKFVHPMLSKREHEIDEYIAKAKEQSYKQMLDLGSKGVNVLMQTAIKGGGGIVNQLRKSYSLSDLSNSHDQAESDETDSVAESVVLRKKRVPYAASTTSAIYFSEVDVRHDVMAHIPSPEDAGFGYSSGDSLYSGQLSKAQSKESLVRSGSIGSTRPRSVRITRSTTVPKNTAQAVDSNVSNSLAFINTAKSFILKFVFTFSGPVKMILIMYSVKSQILLANFWMQMTIMH
uniref:Receptor expression-enhancing protein n=1 Tax=Photinus pyralis TaxID=7054 RepID=A0A1Y1L248_PHOPY